MEEDNSLWEYNAPQFVDFKSMEDDENVEEYFNFDHENGGGPTTLDISEIGHNSLRSSQRHTPQKPATPRRGTTPGRAASTPTRTPLKDNNDLTPRRSTRIKSANTPRAEKNIAKETTAEKENKDAIPATSDSDVVQPNTRAAPSNLCTDPEEWNRKKNSAKPSSNNMPKKTAPKRHSEVTPTPPDQGGESHKRLRRSVSNALVRPGATLSQSKSRSRRHSRSGSTHMRAPVSALPLQRPADTHSSQAKAHTRTNSTQGKTHIRTNSAQGKTHVRTNSTQGNTHVRTNSAQAKTHIRTNSAQGKMHVRTTSAQAKAHVRTNSAQAKTHIRSNSTQGRTHMRTNSSQSESMIRSQSSDRGRTEGRHQRTASSSMLPKMRSASMDRRAPTATKLEGPKLKPMLTLPMTPAVLKHDLAKSNAEHKTTEEREMEKIKKLRSELAQKRKLAEESLKMAQSSSGYQPVRSVYAPTKAEGFHFATDQRLKGHETDTAYTADKDFVSSLRNPSARRSRHNLSTDSQKSSSGLTITIPEPFHLHESKRRDVTNKKYQSTAEIMKAFSSKTPDRFRSKPANKEPTPPHKHGSEAPSITIPKTPNLETRSRYRPVMVMSQAQIDEQEIEELKKYKFKANPVNEKIFKNCGLHKVQPKEATRPEEFDFESDRRVRDRPDHRQEQEESYEFHAKPIARGILEGTVGIKPARDIPLTRPASPAFALKNRLRSFKPQAQVEMEEQTKSSIRANPVPHLGIPFQPKLSHRITEIQPFSFERRNKRMIAKKEETLQKVIDDEKKLREFHANPLPSDCPDTLPVKLTKPPTLPEPFHMDSERVSHNVDDWSTKLEEELRQQRAQASFRAKPAKSIYMQPFMPKRSTKTLTDVQQFDLSTDRRKDRWAELDRYKYEKEAESSAVHMATEKRKREEEQHEIKRLRSEAVHQAKPVRQYNKVDIKRSERPLTRPETPRFSERLKSRIPDKS